MSTSPDSPFLSLQQELRDMIYELAFAEQSLPWPAKFQRISCPSSSKKDPKPFIHFTSQFPSRAPKPTWLNVTLCCRQMRQDVQAYFLNLRTKEHSEPEPPAALHLYLAPKSATAVWTAYPAHPLWITRLNINITISYFLDRENLSTHPRRGNKILRVLFVALKKYIRHGPHFAKASPLVSPMRLDNLALEISPAGMTGESYGFPGTAEQEFREVYRVFIVWLKRLANSGLLWPRIRRIECRPGKMIKVEKADVFPIGDGFLGEGEEQREMLEKLGFSDLELDTLPGPELGQLRIW